MAGYNELTTFTSCFHGSEILKRAKEKKSLDWMISLFWRRSVDAPLLTRRSVIVWFLGILGIRFSLCKKRRDLNPYLRQVFSLLFIVIGFLLSRVLFFAMWINKKDLDISFLCMMIVLYDDWYPSHTICYHKNDYLQRSVGEIMINKSWNRNYTIDTVLTSICKETTNNSFPSLPPPLPLPLLPSPAPLPLLSLLPQLESQSSVAEVSKSQMAVAWVRLVRPKLRSSVMHDKFFWLSRKVSRTAVVTQTKS